MSTWPAPFRVLDAARRAGVERTVPPPPGDALIGDATPPVDERSLPKPISPYGASKLAGEGYAYAFAKAYDLRTVALRFANVYGPWSARKRGAITTFFNRLHSGEPLVIYGDGSSVPGLHPRGRHLQRAAAGPGAGPAGRHHPALSPGVETTAQELAELCRTTAGRPDHPIEYQPTRRGEVDRNFANYELAEKLLGYAPTISREDGLPSTWEWFNEYVFRR